MRQEKHHALVLTDVRPNSMMGDYAFVEINGSGMDVKFHLGWDATEGERYYKDKTKISEQEFSEYFKRFERTGLYVTELSRIAFKSP